MPPYVFTIIDGLKQQARRAGRDGVAHDDIAHDDVENVMEAWEYGWPTPRVVVPHGS